MESYIDMTNVTSSKKLKRNIDGEVKNEDISIHFEPKIQTNSELNLLLTQIMRSKSQLPRQKIFPENFVING